MKNNNQYVAGVPDLWFSGTRADLWVEMKFVPKLPKQVPLRPYKLLSPLQLAWLRDRHLEGRNVCVIIGCKRGRLIEGIVLTSLDWEQDIPVQHLDTLIRSKIELAEWIVNQVQ